MKLNGSLARTTRIERGYSVSALARKIRMDKTQLSKAERGLEGLGPSSGRKLADELELPMHELFPELADLKASQ